MKGFCFLTASLMLVVSNGRAVTFDPPDLNLEYQMHRSYTSVQTPVPLDFEADEDGYFETYHLQKGESLWGLSQMLYGDGNFWPKVWSQNRSITNPHLVRKGHSLQILLGSEDEAPAFRFTEEDGSGVELAAANVPVAQSRFFAQAATPPPAIQPAIDHDNDGPPVPGVMPPAAMPSRQFQPPQTAPAASEPNMSKADNMPSEPSVTSPPRRPGPSGPATGVVPGLPSGSSFGTANGPSVPIGTAGSSPVEIPPPEKPPRPLIYLPKSLPAWQEVYRTRSEEITIDDSNLKQRYSKVVNRIAVDGYVQEKPLEPVGQFLENENESGLPVPNQHVYVKVKKGSGKVGERLLVVKDHGPIQSWHGKMAGEFKARFIEVYGDLELIEVAPSSFKDSEDAKNYDIYRALVLHATSLSLSKHDLIPGQVQMVEMSDQGPSGSVAANVIGSTKHKSSALYGPGDIVFLNKGSSDGVQIGQMLDVYMDRRVRDSQTPVGVSAYPSGRVKIVRVDSSCATGVLIRSVDGVIQGDKIQAPVSRLDSKTVSDASELPDLPDDDALEPADDSEVQPSDADFDLSE